MPMHASYDFGLVILSLIVAILASYTALDLSGRVYANVGRARLLWIVGGAFAMGAGIWTMHFVGMLAFRLPVRVSYDAPLVTLSVAVAMTASGLALWVVSRPRVHLSAHAAAALAMGLAIAGMHYIGMAAMRVAAHLHYDPLRWWLSIGIAIGASFVALDLARRFSGTETRTRPADAGPGGRRDGRRDCGHALHGHVGRSIHIPVDFRGGRRQKAWPPACSRSRWPASGSSSLVSRSSPRCSTVFCARSRSKPSSGSPWRPRKRPAASRATSSPR